MKRALFLIPLLFAACGSTEYLRDASGGEADATDPQRAKIDAVIEDFHLAASDADGERYFGHMTAEGVFLGTDATERWTKEEFRGYADPYFSEGRGWTYRKTERHIHVAPSGETAWFDERLWNDKYGECRGSGVLLRNEGIWKIAQYNLTIPLPNDIAGNIVDQIKAHTGAAR